MKTYVLTSGYFNPLHPGHIDCFELARELGDELWVIINNDKQILLKRGTVPFQNEIFRMRVVGALKPVDKVSLSIDEDESVCISLEQIIIGIRKKDSQANIIFAKGGDVLKEYIPERRICTMYEVDIVDGLGDKTHHSSDYIPVL